MACWNALFDQACVAFAQQRSAERARALHARRFYFGGVSNGHRSYLCTPEPILGYSLLSRQKDLAANGVAGSC